MSQPQTGPIALLDQIQVGDMRGFIQNLSPNPLYVKRGAGASATNYDFVLEGVPSGAAGGGYAHWTDYQGQVTVYGSGASYVAWWQAQPYARAAIKFTLKQPSQGTGGGGSGAAKGIVNLVAGQDFITVAGANLPFIPSDVRFTCRKALSTDQLFDVNLRGDPTSDGFTADLTFIPPDGTYKLGYEFIS